MKAVPNIKIKIKFVENGKKKELSFYYQMIFERATNIEKSIISLSFLCLLKKNTKMRKLCLKRMKLTFINKSFIKYMLLS